LFSLAALHFGGSDAHVVAVEASANASKILTANLAANGASNRVDVVNAAMGATNGTLQMLSTGPAGSDYFVSAPADRTDTIPVRQLSMPGVLRQTRLIPTHVKMDIEGFEDEAISGALESLREHRPVLFLELHVRFLRTRGRDPAAILERLCQCGYVRFEENGITLSIAELAAREMDCRIVCMPE
jgi:FkbM family methyltransferase